MNTLVLDIFITGYILNEYILDIFIIEYILNEYITIGYIYHQIYCQQECYYWIYLSLDIFSMSTLL